MKEEEKLLAKIGLCLHLVRREMANVGFMVAALPFLSVMLYMAVAKSGQWWLHLLVGLLWIMWSCMQCRFIVRRGRICREIMGMEGSGEKWGPMIGRMGRLSRGCLVCLASVILGPAYFALAALMWRESRLLRREYERVAEGGAGWDVENDLDRSFRSQMKKRH